MEKHNVGKTKDWLLSHAKYISLINALHLLDHIEVESELKTREHTFSCGTDGEIVDELTVKIKFGDNLCIQPHTAFKENLTYFFIKTLVETEIEPWLDNIND